LLEEGLQDRSLLQARVQAAIDRQYYGLVPGSSPSSASSSGITLLEKLYRQTILCCKTLQDGLRDPLPAMLEWPYRQWLLQYNDQ